MSSKISALTALAAASVDTAADLLPIVDTSATQTKKITPAALRGALSLPYVLARGGVPIIGLSSGSVDASGNITGITALPIAYPSAFCYFPANILATSIAAGFYYCTFSTTTAGVAFLNTIASTLNAAGIPTIPSSPTAVTDGKGAFTGDTGEEAALQISLSANSLGVNGAIRIRTAQRFSNTAGVKTIKYRYSGAAGTVFVDDGRGSVLSTILQGVITNRGATNVQTGNSTVTTTAASNSASMIAGAIDTTAATSVVVSLQRAAATDNVILESYDFEVLA